MKPSVNLNIYDFWSDSTHDLIDQSEKNWGIKVFPPKYNLFCMSKEHISSVPIIEHCAVTLGDVLFGEFENACSRKYNCFFKKFFGKLVSCFISATSWLKSATLGDALKQAICPKISKVKNSAIVRQEKHLITSTVV